jgi:hypothetical protein
VSIFLKLSLYLILFNKMYINAHMFNNVYKKQVLQRKIKNIIILKNDKNNT